MGVTIPTSKEVFVISLKRLLMDLIAEVSEIDQC